MAVGRKMSERISTCGLLPALVFSWSDLETRALALGFDLRRLSWFGGVQQKVNRGVLAERVVASPRFGKCT